MNEGIIRVMKMVEEGKLTAEEGAELIAAMGSAKEAPSPSQDVNVHLTENSPKSGLLEGFDRESFMKNDVKAAPGETFLQVRVLSADGDKVKINLPLNFVKSVLRLTGKLPMIQAEQLEGIDMKELMDTINAAIDSDLTGRIVDVESANGDLVVVEIVQV